MINIFRGEHAWLSNMYECGIEYKDYLFNSVENAYMWEKNPEDPEWLKMCLVYSAGKIKRESKAITIRNDWDEIKLNVMETLLTIKFNQEPFKTKLIETGDQNIVEGTLWGDSFWGVDLKVNPNYGENHLGRLIMKIRDQLKDN